MIDEINEISELHNDGQFNLIKSEYIRDTLETCTNFRVLGLYEKGSSDRNSNYVHYSISV